VPRRPKTLENPTGRTTPRAPTALEKLQQKVQAAKQTGTAAQPHVGAGLAPAMSQPTDSDSVRDAIKQAKRDFAGFLEGGDQPFLTEDQVEWIAWRISVESDAEANELMATDTGPWPQSTVDRWRQNPQFKAIEEISKGNKREGFKILGTHLLPLALRQCLMLMNSSTEKSVVEGLKLFLRTQAMLIDKVTVVGQDELAQLFAKLNAPRQVQIIPGGKYEVIDGEATEIKMLPEPEVDLERD